MSLVRNKKRYLLFKIFSEEKISERELAFEIFKNTGIFYSKIDPKIRFENDFGIIRTNPKAIEDLERVLALITEVNGKRVHILPFYISGSLKKIEERMENEKKEKESERNKF
jgi:RNase P/RNase MRP subunit POP5